MVYSNQKNQTVTPSRIETVIGKDVVIDGNLTSIGSVRLTGRVKGNVICDSRLMTDSDSEITGKITANLVEIDGIVTGDIYCSKISTDTGARIEGRIAMVKIDDVAVPEIEKVAATKKG